MGVMQEKRAFLAEAEATFYMEGGLSLARAHLRPSGVRQLPSRRQLTNMAAGVLGEATFAYPHNTLRTFISAAPSEPAEVEGALRLAGALRRWAELSFGREMSSGREAAAAARARCWKPWEPMPFPSWANEAVIDRGINSPVNEWVYPLRRALIAAGYNADSVWYALQRVTRWTGCSRAEALDAIAVSRRPRRAALVVRWKRLGVNPAPHGEATTWWQWREAATRLLATPTRKVGEVKEGGIVDDGYGRYQLVYLETSRHGIQLWGGVDARGREHYIAICGGDIWWVSTSTATLEIALRRIEAMA